MTQISDSGGRIWWSNPTYDHLDRVTAVRKGNALWTQRVYDPEDSLVTAIKTGPTLGSTNTQNLSFGWDGLGNLTSRGDGSKSESFGYDNLNRLTTRNGGAIADYADNGNIEWKKDVTDTQSANYAYAGPRPHAVTSAWGFSLDYDANGNLATRTGNGQTWSTKWAGFDKPRWLAKTAGSTTAGSEFLHDSNRDRVMQLEFDAMDAGAPSHYVRKKIYVGRSFEADYRNFSIDGDETAWDFHRIRIYVNAPDGTAGAVEMAARTAIASDHQAQVYHHDHLGSIESITGYGNTSGSLTTDECGLPSRYSYDPWGERRDPTDWIGKPLTTTTGGTCDLTPRGYTGHEMLDGLGLVYSGTDFLGHGTG